MGLVDQRRNSVKNIHTMITPSKVCFVLKYVVVVLCGSRTGLHSICKLCLKNATAVSSGWMSLSLHVTMAHSVAPDEKLSIMSDTAMLTQEWWSVKSWWNSWSVLLSPQAFTICTGQINNMLYITIPYLNAFHVLKNSAEQKFSNDAGGIFSKMKDIMKIQLSETERE